MANAKNSTIGQNMLLFPKEKALLLLLGPHTETVTHRHRPLSHLLGTDPCRVCLEELRKQTLYFPSVTQFIGSGILFNSGLQV